MLDDFNTPPVTEDDTQEYTPLAPAQSKQPSPPKPPAPKPREIDLDDVAYCGNLVEKRGHLLFNTNDRDALKAAGYGEYVGAEHFELAWRILASLVWGGQIKVNFTDPDWSRQCMFAVMNIAEELERGRRDS